MTASWASTPPPHTVPVSTPWWRHLTDLLVPVQCAGCGQPGASPCPTCCATLVRARPVLHPGLIDHAPVVTAARYDGAVRGLLLAHKERGRIGLATPLGSALGAAVRQVLLHAEEPMQHLVLVPVPSRASAVRARGRSTVGELARVAAAELDAPGARCVVGHWVVPARSVQDQTGLDAAARRANLHGALVAEPPRGHPRGVIVVDDIVTTGASISESVRALRRAGHRVIGVAGVARASHAHGAPDRGSSRRIDRE